MRSFLARFVESPVARESMMGEVSVQLVVTTGALLCCCFWDRVTPSHLDLLRIGKYTELLLQLWVRKREREREELLLVSWWNRCHCSDWVRPRGLTARTSLAAGIQPQCRASLGVHSPRLTPVHHPVLVERFFSSEKRWRNRLWARSELPFPFSGKKFQGLPDVMIK